MKKVIILITLSLLLSTILLKNATTSPKSKVTINTHENESSVIKKIKSKKQKKALLLSDKIADTKEKKTLLQDKTEIEENLDELAKDFDSVALGALIDSYEEILTKDSDNLEALDILTTLYETAGEKKKALNSAEKCITINPESYDCQKKLVRLSLSSQKLRTTQNHISNCLHVNPKHFNCIITQAKIYEQQERDNEALSFYKSALVSQLSKLPRKYYKGTKSWKAKKAYSYAQIASLYKRAGALRKFKKNIKLACFYHKAYCQKHQ